MTTPAQERLLDVRGRRCPMPVIELARTLLEVPVGSVVRVLSDDPAAASDIPSWCELKGQDYLGSAPVDPADLGAGSSYAVRRTS